MGRTRSVVTKMVFKLAAILVLLRMSAFLAAHGAEDTWKEDGWDETNAARHDVSEKTTDEVYVGKAKAYLKANLELLRSKHPHAFSTRQKDTERLIQDVARGVAASLRSSGSGSAGGGAAYRARRRTVIRRRYTYTTNTRRRRRYTTSTSVACFPSKAVVHTERNGKVSIDKLVVGDKVMTHHGYSEVMFFAVRKPKTAAKFLKITTSNSTLVLTSSHAVFKIDNTATVA